MRTYICQSYQTLRLFGSVDLGLAALSGNVAVDDKTCSWKLAVHLQDSGFGRVRNEPMVWSENPRPISDTRRCGSVSFTSA